MPAYRNLLSELGASLGIERNSTTHGEKLISAVGAILGVLTVYWVSQWYLHTFGVYLMVASLGASAVLLFAVPHGALSQPWPLVGGHLVSAFVGVSMQKLCPDPALAAALAVGLSVVAMYYLRCLHPPGGATAMFAVIGGEQIASLGYTYLVTPVGLNVVAILLVALAFNGLFHWRRYPAYIVRRRSSQPVATMSSGTPLTHEDLAAAIQQFNSYIDVTSEDLAQLFELAVRHAHAHHAPPGSIASGRFYSNGQTGSRWCIRQVTEIRHQGEPRKETIFYRNVAGSEALAGGSCSRREFLAWAQFEVENRNGHWVRVSASTH